MTILIVDDDAGIREMMTVLLEYKGYAAISAANGLEALTTLQQTHPLPQLILLDWMMPVMNGAEFQQAQQQHPDLAGIPIVVLSGTEDIEQQAAAAYLPKPIDFDALLSLVEHYDGHTRQAQM